MTTLTVSTNFLIADRATEEIAATIFITPAAGAGSGRGRLIHPDPSLGTFDYLRGPNEWVNVDGDVIIPPVWSSSKTLLGAANTLFVGNIRDVIVEECWTNSTACMEATQARMLVAMWQNPPDPSVGYVEWWPSYSNALGFYVVILECNVGGQGVIRLDPLTKNGVGWVRGPVSLKMRIVGRVA